jgi:glycosyltransferase involved in cell wall biosynthesis
MVGGDKRDGSLDEARTLAAKLELGDAVDFRGAVPKHLVGSVLAEGDIFLNTSRVDNTPVSVIEAMACGLCVVSTDVGGIPHLIRDGENGLLTPSDDTDAMHQAVMALLSQPERSFAISQNAICSVRNFDWANVLDRWEAILHTCGGRFTPAVASVTI